MRIIGRKVSCGALVAIWVTCAAAAAEAGEQRIAAVPLANGTDDGELEPLSFVLAEAVYAAVAGAPGVVPVDRLHLMDALIEKKVLDHGTDDLARRAGTMVGATHVVLGSYSTAGGVARVSLRLVAVASRQVEAIGEAHAPATDLLGLRDEVYCTVRKRFAATAPDATCDVAAAHLTESTGAQQSYAESLLALYRGRQADARTKLAEALSLDPDFAAARELRDALWWTVAPGNEWVYDFGYSGGGGPSGKMVRRVTAAKRGADGELTVTIALAVPTLVTPLWGECDETEHETFVLRDGWARLVETKTEHQCRKLEKPFYESTRYDPPLPWLPLNATAAATPPPEQEFSVVVAVEGVAEASMTRRCSWDVEPVEDESTPMGELDGIAVEAHCENVGQKLWTIHNRDRVRRYQEKVKAANTKADQYKGLEPGLIAAALLEAYEDEVPQPQDVPAANFPWLSLKAIDLEQIMVPGVGISSLEIHSVFDSAKATHARADLEGMTMRRLSPLSPPLVLGEIHAGRRSALGGRPIRLGMGLLALILRPKYERYWFRYAADTTDLSLAGNLVGLSGSIWLHDVVRLGGGIEIAGLAWPTGAAEGELKTRYGEHYNLYEMLGLDANVRFRGSARGLWSVPQLEAGVGGNVFFYGNLPPSPGEDENGNDLPPPADFDKGTYGKELDGSHSFWRFYAGIVAQFSFHDRIILEGSYRLSRWAGSFGFDDRGGDIAFDTQGARGMICFANTALANRPGLGLCLHGYGDWALRTQPQGTADRGVVHVGGLLELTILLGRFRSER